MSSTVNTSIGSADNLMSTPIAVFNPTAITLIVLTLLVIPAILLKPDRLMQWLERKKYQYEVTIPLYMMTPAERFILNSILFLLLSITGIAVCLYMPDHIAHIAKRVYYYINGGDPP